MTSRHYDVVLLGRSIGTLLTAALLARRELRVLVLGQGELPSSYRVEGHVLRRRAFTFLAATSPAFRRIMQELAQTQRFRRLTSPLDPMFSVLDGKKRFEIPPDLDLFSREIDREFPEVHQPIAELYALISDANARIDAAFERNAVWPPGTLIERMETGRLAASLPLVETDETRHQLLDRMPSGHDFGKVLLLPALFAAHLGMDESELPPFAVARLHGSWTRGIHSLAGGEAELEDFLVERITAHGGACRLRDRAVRIIVRRGKAVGVMEDGEDDMTGADAVVSNWMGEAIADLTGGEGVTKKATESWPRIEAVGGRFVVNLVVRRRGLPEPLGTESFLVAPSDTLPTVHLQRIETANPQADGSDEPEDGEENPRALREPHTLLVAETLLPSAGGLHLLGAREATLATLRHYLPFLDEHLLAVDSPHDGLPAWLYDSPAGKREVERVHLPETESGAEPMQWRLSVSPRGYLGLAGEPVRGPVPGTFLVGPSVLPGLGQEGEVLAAWSVARILTKKDKSRQKLRRQMWTKFETG